MVSFFFYPKTIAVIGATDNPQKFGNAVTINILQNKNLNSEIFLVSPTGKEISGLKCYLSVLDIPKDVDIAIILVPSKVIDKVVDQCISKNVKGIIIVTAGFGELNKEGKKKEREISSRCKKAGIRVMGPNCVGVQNSDIGLNASFIQTAPHGEIGMISQSGSFGCASFYAMEREYIGCSKFANIGNNIDVSFSEILEFLLTDKSTNIISLYMETVENGRGLLKSLKKVVNSKPIVVLKGGRTEYGMRAASSHTGSIASNYVLLKNSLKQTGVLLCENVSDFVVALKTLSYIPIPKGEQIGVLTNSGGCSVLFSDKAEEFHLKLAEFSHEFKEKASHHLLKGLVKFINPLDMIGAADENTYYNVTKLMLEDSKIDIVVACVVIPPFLEMKPDEHYRGIIRAWNETGRKKPLIPLLMFSEEFKSVRELAIREKTTVFFTPHEASFAIKVLINRMNLINHITENDI